MPLPSSRTPSTRVPDGTFRVLTVCTGNICRSPQLAMLLEQQLPRVFGVANLPQLIVSSAGTIAREGEPMDPQAGAEAVRFGLDHTEAHAARRLQGSHIETADLVLGLSREHRAEIVDLVPAASRRVFTLKEFVHIVRCLVDPAEEISVGSSLRRDRSGPEEFFSEVVREASSVRGMIPRSRERFALDIEDPYRRSPEVYRRSAESIRRSVEKLVSDLTVLSGHN